MHKNSFKRKALALSSYYIQVLDYFLNENRELLLNKSLNKATIVCEELVISVIRRVRRKRIINGVKARDATRRD